jgi:hypothetical protein
VKAVYRVLAYVVAAEVIVQAMAMVYGIAGLGKWVDSGGVFDKSVMESDESPFPEIVGIIIHGVNGMIVIPAIALLLVVSSFFARIPGAVKWASPNGSSSTAHALPARRMVACGRRIPGDSRPPRQWRHHRRDSKRSAPAAGQSCATQSPRRSQPSAAKAISTTAAAA